MDNLSNTNQDFLCKKPFLLKKLSELIKEELGVEHIASHFLLDFHPKKQTNLLPIVYIMNNQIFLIERQKEKNENPFLLATGCLIGCGSYSCLFNLDQKAIKVPLEKKDFALLKKNMLALKEEAILLDEIHKTGCCLGIQKKISLKKVYDVWYVKEHSVESFRKNLSIQNQPSFEIYISEGFLYQGTLEDFIISAHNNKNYMENVFQMQSDLAFGLDFIHSLNIVHGDIKHKNIFYEVTQTKAHAYLADFGSADKIIHTDLVKKISAPLYCSLACTRGEDIGDYNTPAKLINALVSKNLPLINEEEEKIRTLKKHCQILRKQIDVFQLGVAFYQMAIKSTRKVPYPFIEKLGPQNINPEKVKATLQMFYKDTDKIDCILLMLSSNPRNRPSAKKIKEIFSTSS